MRSSSASITGTVVGQQRAVVLQMWNVTATNLGTREVDPRPHEWYRIYSYPQSVLASIRCTSAGAGLHAIDVAEITLQSTQVAKFDETLAVGTVTQASRRDSPRRRYRESQTASIRGQYQTGQKVIDPGKTQWPAFEGHRGGGGPGGNLRGGSFRCLGGPAPSPAPGLKLGPGSKKKTPFYFNKRGGSM